MKTDADYFSKVASVLIAITTTALMAYAVSLIGKNISKTLVKRIQLFFVQGVVSIFPFSTIDYNICFNQYFHITQPTLSHDMKLLCDVGVVTSRKEGKWMHYSLNFEKMNEIYKIIGQLMVPDEFQKIVDCDCNK